VTLGQMLGIIFLLYSKGDHVRAALPFDYDKEEYKDAERSFEAAIGLSIAFLIVELIGLLAGVSLFFTAVAFVDSLLHGLGCVLLVMFITNEWRSETLWILFPFISLVPFVCEVWAFVAVFGLQVMPY